MRSRPATLSERELLACLADGWGLDVRNARYVPEGGGSYHWDVTDAAGNRHFVTADDLDRKAWLGHDRDSTFAGLRAAFDAALALRRDGGLAFVVAPVPAASGETLRRIDSRYSAALFPYVDGSPRGFDAARPALERAEVIRLLARLHDTTPVVRPVAAPRHLDLPLRGRLEAALRELDRPWTGGPFSERVRELLAEQARELWRWLETFDRLAIEVAAWPDDFVITHGEPHGGNLLRTAAQEWLLIDWDTVGLAPPERDLWHVARDPGDLALYTEATGRGVDARAIALYRLRWALDDIAIFASELRSPHAATADAERAWDGLNVYLRSEEWRSAASLP
jgi:spectinomycin phosphotransferase